MEMDWSNPLVYIVAGGAILGWVIRVERGLSKKDESITFLKDAVKELKSDIKQLFRDQSAVSTGSVVERNSPLHLTDRGHSISEELDVTAWATQTAQDIFPKLKVSHPYDVQVFCMDYVDHPSNFDTEFMDRIKYYAYEEGFSMSQIRDVLAIELRDAIVKKLPD